MHSIGHQHHSDLAVWFLASLPGVRTLLFLFLGYVVFGIWPVIAGAVLALAFALWANCHPRRISLT